MSALSAPMQRTFGTGKLRVHRSAGAVRIASLFQEGAAKIRFPRTGDAKSLDAILINTSGGLTGGDRMIWDGQVDAGSRAVFTTQACEKVYKSSAGVADVAVSLTAKAGSTLAWLPQETILFDRSAISRTIDVDLATDATCLLLEPLIFGRKAMGEAVRETRFRDRWRVRVDGELVHAEDIRFEGDASAILERNSVAAGATAMATVLLIDPSAHDKLASARKLIEGHEGVRAGISAWRIGKTGKLLARLVASDGYCLRRALIPLVGMLNGRAGLPKIWTN